MERPVTDKRARGDTGGVEPESWPTPALIEQFRVCGSADFRNISFPSALSLPEMPSAVKDTTIEAADEILRQYTPRPQFKIQAGPTLQRARALADKKCAEMLKKNSSVYAAYFTAWKALFESGAIEPFSKKEVLLQILLERGVHAYGQALLESVDGNLQDPGLRALLPGGSELVVRMKEIARTAEDYLHPSPNAERGKAVELRDEERYKFSMTFAPYLTLTLRAPNVLSGYRQFEEGVRDYYRADRARQYRRDNGRVLSDSKLNQIISGTVARENSTIENIEIGLRRFFYQAAETVEVERKTSRVRSLIAEVNRKD